MTYQNTYTEGQVKTFAEQAKFRFSIKDISMQAYNLFKANMGNYIIFGLVASFLTTFIAPGFSIGAYKQKRGILPDFNAMIKVFDHAGEIVYVFLAQLVGSFVAMGIFFVFFFALMIGGAGMSGLGSLSPEAGAGIGVAFIFLYFILYFILFLLVFIVQAIFLFAPELIMFGNMKGMDAVKASWNIFRRNAVKIMLFILAFQMIPILIGILTCGIGVLLFFFTTPIFYIAIHLIFEEEMRPFANNADDTDLTEHLVDY